MPFLNISFNLPILYTPGKVDVCAFQCFELNCGIFFKGNFYLFVLSEFRPSDFKSFLNPLGLCLS